MPYSVHRQPWPSYDPALTQDAAVEVVVQINGKVRDRVNLSPDTPEELAMNYVLKRPKVVEALAGRDWRKRIYVPGRLINIVV
jgi:leucyl-tRNA synthetase